MVILQRGKGCSNEIRWNEGGLMSGVSGDKDGYGSGRWVG